jgi:hypothetical protein
MATDGRMTSAEIERVIARIEASPSSYVGGVKAWNTGRRIELTAAAKRQIAALEKKLAAIADRCPDD